MSAGVPRGVGVAEVQEVAAGRVAAPARRRRRLQARHLRHLAMRTAWSDMRARRPALCASCAWACRAAVTQRLDGPALRRPAATSGAACTLPLRHHLGAFRASCSSASSISAGSSSAGQRLAAAIGGGSGANRGGRGGALMPWSGNTSGGASGGGRELRDERFVHACVDERRSGSLLSCWRLRDL